MGVGEGILGYRGDDCRYQLLSILGFIGVPTLSPSGTTNVADFD